MLNEDKFNISNQHSIPYEDHRYVIDKSIINDYNNLNKNEILKKLAKIFKKISEIFFRKNEQIGTSYIKLTELFLQEYKDVNINYDLIFLEEEKTLFENFKKRNKYNTNRDIQIRDVINIKNFSMGAIYNKKYKNRLKCNFDNLINDFKINDINIVQNLKVTFERKNKLYNKDIYCMMSKEMEENIKSPENTQYFSDVTYYCVPPNNK